MIKLRTLVICYIKKKLLYNVCVTFRIIPATDFSINRHTVQCKSVWNLCPSGTRARRRDYTHVIDTTFASSCVQVYTIWDPYKTGWNIWPLDFLYGITIFIILLSVWRDGGDPGRPERARARRVVLFIFIRIGAR